MRNPRAVVAKAVVEAIDTIVYSAKHTGSLHISRNNV